MNDDDEPHDHSALEHIELGKLGDGRLYRGRKGNSRWWLPDLVWFSRVKPCKAPAGPRCVWGKPLLPSALAIILLAPTACPCPVKLPAGLHYHLHIPKSRSASAPHLALAIFPFFPTSNAKSYFCQLLVLCLICVIPVPAPPSIARLHRPRPASLHCHLPTVHPSLSFSFYM